MIIAVLAVLGLIFGSFVNALVWRLHEQQQSAKKAKREYSILHGHSMCPQCHHELAAKDLVPVVSWLALRGRCRYCGKPISWQYPAVELLTGLLFVLSYLWWPLSLHGIGLFQFVVWLGFVVGFVALAVYDLRWFILPNRVVYPLIALAVAEVAVVSIDTHSWHFLWQAGVGGLITFGIFYLLFQVSGGKWIGGGDVKLAIVLGLLAATPLKAFLVIFLASILGTVASIPLLLKGKQGLKAKVPFGPFLLVATLLTVLFGTTIINWYTSFAIR